MEQQHDHYYIEQVKAGRTAAFSYLVDKYQDMVYGLALKLVRNEADAQELAQDSFVKAFKSLASYQQRSKFSTWLYRITYNGCISFLRKRKVEVRSLDEQHLSDRDEVWLDGQFSALDKQMAEKLLNEALAQLPELEQVLITLYYYEDQKVEEISQITGLSESNVKVKIHRARKKMHDNLYESWQQGIFNEG